MSGAVMHACSPIEAEIGRVKVQGQLSQNIIET
jgi:hypothetical protein